MGTGTPAIFLSYSHLDEQEKDRIVAHLNVLRHEGVEIWVDDDLVGGDDWEREILDHVDRATVAVLLVTANFLGSEFILGTELPRLLERREKGELTIFPIIAKHCAWQKVQWLCSMNVRPKNGVPVWSDDGADISERLARLAGEIAELLIRGPSPIEPKVSGDEPHAKPGRTVMVDGERLAIHYDPKRYRREFLEVLDGFSKSLESEPLQRTFGRDRQHDWKQDEETIRRRLDADFTMAVIGRFKSGKSTLVNALLGQNVVTSDVAPETVSINEIRYGEEVRIEACLVDGGRVTLTTAQLQREVLVPILDKLPCAVSHLDIRVPVPWLRGICLVDTPGTGDLMKRFDRQVQKYVANADTVLVVLSPLAPLSESERAFLELALLPQDFAKLTFVVNMLDRLRTEIDVRKIMDLLDAKIKRLFPDAFLFGVSALDELRRLDGGDRPRPERRRSLAASFEAVNAHLQELILHNRDLIRLDRAAAETKRLLKSVAQHARRLQRALQTDHSSLDGAIQACEDESSEYRDQIERSEERVQQTGTRLAKEARGWLDEFIDRLESASRGIGAYDIDDLQRHFPFFFADALRQAIHRCLEFQRPRMLAELQRTEGELGRILESLIDCEGDRVLSEPLGEAGFGDSAWDHLDTSEVLFSFVQTQVFGVVVELVKHVGNSSRERRQALLFEQHFRASLRQLRDVVLRESDDLYREMTDRLLKGFREQQRYMLNSSLVAFRQARQLQCEGIDRVGEVIEHSVSSCEETREALDDLQMRMWGRHGEERDEGGLES